MRLELPIPDGWRAEDVEAGRRVTAPGGYDLLVMPMRAAEPVPQQWLERALLIDRPPQVPTAVRVGRFETNDGWQGLFLAGRVGGEARFVVYFAFLDYAVTVLATCAAPADHPAWEAEVLALLQRARPIFADGKVHGLVDLLGQPPSRETFEARQRMPIAGWQRTMAAGNVVLVRADQVDAGQIRITADRTPLQTVRELFGTRTVSVFATDEAEYAAMATWIEQGRQHSVAAVFGESSFMHVEAVVTDRALFALFEDTVRELAYAGALGLGARRWRPYYFEPPAGWTGIARPHHTLWLPPELPRRYQVLRVFDARPVEDHERRHGARVFETLPNEFFAEPPKGPALYYTADDHECRVHLYTATIGGAKIHVLDGQIVTDPYVYPLRIELDPAIAASCVSVFERVVASVRILPERRRTTDTHPTAITHWAE